MIARPISEVVAQEVGDGFFALGRKFERNRIVGLLRLHLPASEADFMESLIAAPERAPDIPGSGVPSEAAAASSSDTFPSRATG